jgi:hypothetical protein
MVMDHQLPYVVLGKPLLLPTLQGMSFLQEMGGPQLAHMEDTVDHQTWMMEVVTVGPVDNPEKGTFKENWKVAWVKFYFYSLSSPRSMQGTLIEC